MPHLFPILLAILSIYFSYAQESTARGSTPLAVDKNVAGTKRALVIGISDYQEEGLKLKYAKNDARRFEQYLRDYEKVEEIVTLIDAEATAINIQKELNALYNIAQPGDEVYIYFAGHGDVVQLYGEDTGFLLAVDVNDQREYYGTSGVVYLASIDGFELYYE